MSWTNYRSAPAPGTTVCAASDIGAVAAVRVTGPNGAFPMILVRSPAGLRAYVNACPHQYLPLDYQGANILSSDGARLMCTAHGAQFDAATGIGVAGEGEGCTLDEVPVRVEDGNIIIA